MKTMNKLIGRFVLAVGLLSMTVTVAQGSATLAETKEFLWRKLSYGGDANKHGASCILYGENSSYYTKLNLSTIYLDGISAHDWVTLRIDYTKDAEVYTKTYRSEDWRRSGTRDGGSAFLRFSSAVTGTKMVAATKHAAKLCGAKATDPTPPLQFE